VIIRRDHQCGVAVCPHRFRHHFSHTWVERGGPEGDLMELNGWSSPQMLLRYRASARSARARRTYYRIMENRPLPCCERERKLTVTAESGHPAPASAENRPIPSEAAID
jgi:hypothetical protein